MGRYVERDPALPHQVVIKMIGGVTYVSCNCRVSTYRAPMGRVSSFEDTKRLYNDHNNHVYLRRGAPFTAEWMIGKEEEIWSLLPRHSTENRQDDH
jgi:hypothetical protein